MANEFNRNKLQGANLRGKNLAGYDFSYADIRGTDFSNASLIGANFHNAKAGLSQLQAIALIFLSLILSFYAGLISGYAGALLADTIYSSFFLGFISLIPLGIFLIVIVWQGLRETLGILTVIVAGFVITALALFPNNVEENLIWGTQLTVLILAGAMAGIGIMAVALTISRIMALPKARVVTGFIAFIAHIPHPNCHTSTKSRFSSIYELKYKREKVQLIRRNSIKLRMGQEGEVL
jgi:signal transduction histidine kinase